jgi:FAD/FMN-containing dehydrogenase
LLPLSISSEGTAQIGGVLAVNAGGNNTVRYGNARDLVLGLEVVLPDGTIWNGLRRLRKDNTGYCLRQLFVGSEGTLGIITAAVLKLVPQPKEVAVAFCAVDTAAAALDLFARFQAHDAASISAFELMSGLGTSFVLRHIPNATLPLGETRAVLRAGGTGHAATERGPARIAGRGAGGGAVRRHRAGCRDRRIRRATGGDLAIARGTLGSAKARGRQRQE